MQLVALREQSQGLALSPNLTQSTWHTIPFQRTPEDDILKVFLRRIQLLNAKIPMTWSSGCSALHRLAAGTGSSRLVGWKKRARLLFPEGGVCSPYIKVQRD